MVIVRVNGGSKEVVGVFADRHEAYMSLVDFIKNDEMSEDEAFEAYQDCYSESEVLEGLDLSSDELIELAQVLKGAKYNSEIIQEVAEKIASFANENFDFYDKYSDGDAWLPLNVLSKDRAYKADNFYIYDENMEMKKVSLVDFIQDCI